MTASHSVSGSGNRTDSTGLIGLREFAASLGLWQQDPGHDTKAALAVAFERVVAGSGLSGGRICLSAAPLAEVEIRSGSLAGGRRPTAELRAYDLRFGGRSLGNLELVTPPAAVFSVDELGHGIEIVVGSAWSEARANQANDELAALDAATRGIAGVLDLDRVLQLITDRVRELAHAQYAALAVVDAEGLVERFITSGTSRTERERIGPNPRGLGLLHEIIVSSRPIRVPDIAADPRRYGFPANHPDMHSLLGVPIAAKGRSIGRLYLPNKQPAGEFTEDDERVVEMFALHAGIAIENARLHEQVQRLAIVEERERIGRDLHDGIIQSIYAVGLSLEDVPDLMSDEPEEARQRVERAIDSLDQSIRDIRNFIFGLRPELLEQAGLIGGLLALADEFRVNSLVDVDIDTSAIDETDIPPEHTADLLAIAREALSNIARHSKATRGNVLVEARDEIVRISVSDNGVGFYPDQPRGPGHQGLINMRARVAAIGGRINVESVPGAGARIIVESPRRISADDEAATRGDE